ncbi:hypothetical protein BDR26DRAFT_112249 [Obelidium mucronatum]|nr:hypothetical protein BDR26DRAFT_112249 [Obelidium mucronatum]
MRRNALNYLATGRVILQQARDALRDNKGKKRDYSNPFLDNHIHRVKETFKEANTTLAALGSKSAKSIMNSRDERKVSSKRLETAKTNRDTIQKAFASPHVENWSGTDAANWFLDNIETESNTVANEKVLSSIKSQTKIIAASYKLADIRGDNRILPSSRDSFFKKVKCNHCDKLGHYASDCRSQCSSQSCYKPQCKGGSQRYQRDSYRRSDQRRDDRDRDYSRNPGPKTSYKGIRIRSPPFDRPHDK